MLMEGCHCMRKGGVNELLLGLCFCMTPQDARGERVLMKCSCSKAFICRSVTLHDERGKVLSNCSWTYAFV